MLDENSTGRYNPVMNAIIESLREKIASVSSFDAACEITVRELPRLVPHFSWVGIYMRHREELVLTAWDGPEATQHVRIPVGQGICVWPRARERRWLSATSTPTHVTSHASHTRDPRLSCRSTQEMMSSGRLISTATRLMPSRMKIGSSSKGSQQFLED